MSIENDTKKESPIAQWWLDANADELNAPMNKKGLGDSNTLTGDSWIPTEPTTFDSNSLYWFVTNLKEQEDASWWSKLINWRKTS